MKRLVILGALGDLATRHLVPGLAHLEAMGRLPEDLTWVGVDRRPLDDEAYRRHVCAALAEHVPGRGDPDRRRLAARARYAPADLASCPDLGHIAGGEPVVVYLALPPAVLPSAIEALRRAELHPATRIVVEKPFGVDRHASRALTAALHDLVPEHQVFRNDHFLHHQAVQDLVALRLATPWLGAVWNAEHVAEVHIVWDEAVAAAGRAEYYDRAGALLDMLQSHLLELLALVAMEPPQGFGESFRDARAAVLRDIPTPTFAEVGLNTVRGRYAAGVVDGTPVPAYVDEAGVDPERGTETFASARLHIDNARWRGVPFLLRSGKAMGADRKYVEVRFRPVDGGPFAGVGAALRCGMAPDGVTLVAVLAGREGLPALRSTNLWAPTIPALPASARVVERVLAGDPALFVRHDELEECWRVTGAIADGWRAGAAPLQEYAAGGW